MKTLLSRAKVARNPLRSSGLSQNNLRLILAGIIPIFCSFQSTQAVVSSWTALQPSPSDGCDVSIVVESSLAASSSMAFPVASAIGLAGSSLLAGGRTINLSGVQNALEKSNAAVSTFAPIDKAELTLDAPVNATLIRGTSFSALGSAASIAAISANALSIGSFASVSQVREEALPVDGNTISSGDTFLDLAAVPEPSTWGMIVTGIGVVLSSRRIRRSRAVR